jgi:aminopeptidase N
MVFDTANMPAMFPVFEARFGPYAFSRYGQVAVDPFPAGGMEHQGLTTINRSWVTGTRQYEGPGMSHELTHQWWGDKVTLVDFRNIWLNEGFASYGECIWQESFYGATAYANYIVNQMNSALNSDNNVRYALYDPPEANLFGNTIYKKGSLVLHMLRRVLGDTPFFAGMQLYGQRFQYGNASTADFEKAMEDASGQTLNWFFNEWVYDKGLPTYNWGWQTSSAGNGQSNLVVQIRQVQTNAPFFRMPVELKVSRSGMADTTVTILNNAVAQENQLIIVNGTVTTVVFDPRNSIYKRIQQITVDAPRVIPNAGPSIALSAAPNPSRSSSLLRVQLGGTSREAIHMTIYDSGGRAIRALAPSRPGAASADFQWDLTDASGHRVAPGLYFAQARVGANHEERSITVLQ